MITTIIALGILCAAISIVFSILAFLAKITWSVFRHVVWPIAVFFGTVLVIGWLMGHVVLPGFLILAVMIGLLLLSR